MSQLLRSATVISCLVGSSAAAVADAKMAKGPYLQELAPNAITVMWQLEPQSEAELEVTGKNSDGTALHMTKRVSKARIAEATVDGLAPGHRYQYKVKVAQQTWTGEFATAPEVGSNSPFSFAVFGDSRQNADSHRRVVERISQNVPDFLLGTGDMVDDGAKQEQWQTFFEVERALLKDNVYFPAIGNHDRQGRGRTADSYRTYFAVPQNGTDAERYYAFSYGNSRFVVLDSNSHSFGLTDQTAWIERELAAARQDKNVRHIFVVMHHPPYSISLHRGHRDLRERWTPLFEKYAVSAVFSGHDHVYERAEHNGIRYFVSGGGGAPLYAKSPKATDIDKKAVKVYERSYHFLRVAVTKSEVEVAAIRVDGTTIETVRWNDEPDAELVAEKASPAPSNEGPSRLASGVGGGTTGHIVPHEGSEPANAERGMPAPTVVAAPTAPTQAPTRFSFWWLLASGVALAALAVGFALRKRGKARG